MRLPEAKKRLFAAGNWGRTNSSRPSLSQLLTHTKFVSEVPCDPLILGKNLVSESHMIREYIQ